MDLFEFATSISTQEEIHFEINNVNAFVIAARNGHIEIMKRLYYEYKIEVNIGGGEALFSVLNLNFGGGRKCKNRLEILKFLLSIEEFDKYKKNVAGETALHLACKYSEFPVAKYLYEYYKSHNNYFEDQIESLTSNSGLTIFHCACINRSSNLDIVKYFASLEGVDVHLKDKIGRNGFMLYCTFRTESENFTILRYLHQELGISVNDRDYRAKRSSLDSALLHYNYKLIKYLYSIGVSSIIYSIFVIIATVFPIEEIRYLFFISHEFDFPKSPEELTNENDNWKSIWKSTFIERNCRELTPLLNDSTPLIFNGHSPHAAEVSSYIKKI